MKQIFIGLIILVCVVVVIFFANRILNNWLNRNYRYFKLWISDVLADFVGTQPQRVNQFFDRVFKWIKIWSLVWPIVGAAWLSLFLDEIKKSTQLFIDIISSPALELKNFNADYWTITFDVLTIFWLLFFLFFVFVDDKLSANKFNKIRSAIIRAPNMQSFGISRSLLDTAYGLNEKIKDFRGEYADKDYSNIVELIITINTVAANTLKTAREFFNIDAIIGVNVMVFLKKEEPTKQTFQKLLEGSEQIYFRCEQEDNLFGLLYLPSELIVNTDQEKVTPSIIYPIYNDYYQTYKNPNDDSEEYILPGASLAYRRGTSMVGNTRDSKQYFESFDLRTQKELKEFFSANGKGKDIKSLSSFRIPPPNGQEDYIGILNLHSHLSFAFGENEEFFETFYTMIYPVLKLLSENLEIYRNYIIETNH